MHTPGPWRVIPGSRDIVSCGDMLKRRFIAEALESTIKSENQPSVFVKTDLEVYANARLIASAPDLLAALKDIVAICKDGVIERRETGKPTWQALDAMAEIARAAIAAAERRE